VSENIPWCGVAAAIRRCAAGEKLERARVINSTILCYIIPY
jgi:hypothetical protein